MIKHIIKYESRLMRADGVAGITMLVFLCAMGYAGWMGLAYTNEMETERRVHLDNYAVQLAGMHEEAVEREAQLVRDSVSLDTYSWGPRSPYAIGSSQGSLVTYPLTSFAAFAVGQTDLQPAVLKVTMAGVQPAGQVATLENPFKLLVGHFDFAFVFLYIYPLCIIALTFGLTSGERESGLLYILLAQPIRLSGLAVGKLTIRALLLASVIVTGTGVFALSLGGNALGSWAQWVFVSLLYGAFWFGLAVLVDSQVRSAATSALVLTSCWLIFAVVVPALISFFATALYPVPSRMEYITAMRTETTVARQQGAASLARFFEDHPEIAPVSDEDANFAMLRIAQEEQIAEQLTPLEMRYSEQRRKQQQFIDRMGYLSPTILTHQAYLQIAGTDTQRYVQFRNEVDGFQQNWKTHLVPKFFSDVAFRAADYATLPVFEMKNAPGAQRFIANRLPMAYTLFVSGLLFGFGFLSYRRREVIQ